MTALIMIKGGVFHVTDPGQANEGGDDDEDHHHTTVHSAPHPGHHAS